MRLPAVALTSVLFAGPRRIEVQSAELPSPGGGQVLVRSEVSAISAGTELLVYRGQLPENLGVDANLPALQRGGAFPLQYGYAVVGRVTRLGSQVDPGWQGRRVFAFHPHQSWLLASPEELIPLPDNLEPEVAALLPNMETAVNLVHDGRPLLGERVGVFGQGIVGLLTTALLSRCPLQELVTVEPLESRRRFSQAWGAHSSVPPDQAPQDCDLTYEVSGAPATLNQALAATRFSGRVVIGSWYGTKRAEIDLGGAFHRSRIHIQSSQVSTLEPALTGSWSKARRLDLALRLLGELRPASLISHRFPVDQAAQAYQLLDERPQDALQVVLTYPC